MKKNLFLLVITILFTITLINCPHLDPVPVIEPTLVPNPTYLPTPAATIGVNPALIQEVWRHSQAPEIPDKEFNEVIQSDALQGTEIKITKTFKKSVLEQDIFLLGLNNDALYCAALFPYLSIKDGSFAMPYNFPRFKARLSVDLVNGEFPVYIDFDPRYLSNYREALGILLKPYIGMTIPARIEYSFISIYNQSEIFMKLGTSAKWTNADISFDFEEGSTNIKTTMIVSLKQIYYNVAVDRLYMDTAINFQEMNDTTLTRLQNSSPNNFCYVSAISYGRISYLMITSSYDEATVKSSFSAGFDAIAASGSMNIDNYKKQVIAESSIKAVNFGGDAATALQINSVDALEQFIVHMESDVIFNPSKGLPLIISTRSLADGALVSYHLYSEYSLTEYVPAFSIETGYRFHFHFGVVTDDNREQYVRGIGSIILNSTILDPKQLHGYMTVDANVDAPNSNVSFTFVNNKTYNWQVYSRNGQMSVSASGSRGYTSDLYLYYGNTLIFYHRTNDEWWDIGRSTPTVTSWR